MLQLLLEHPASRESLCLGPAPYFLVRGNRLLAGPDETELGYYQDGLWHVQGQLFITARADAPTALGLQDDGVGSDTLGPFEKVALVDGAIRRGPRLGRLVAKFDADAQAWLVYPGRKRYTTIVFSPAEENDATDQPGAPATE